MGVLKFSLGTPRVSGNIDGRPETLSLSVVEFYLTVDIFIKKSQRMFIRSISIAHRSLLSIVILVSFITFSTGNHERKGYLHYHRTTRLSIGQLLEFPFSGMLGCWGSSLVVQE